MRLLCWIFTLCGSLSWAQVRPADGQIKPPTIKKEKIAPPRQALRAIYERRALEAPKWVKYHSLALTLSEMAFRHWKAGGQSSFSAMTEAKVVRRYIASHFFWDNELLLNYGVSIRQGEEFRKMDDKLTLDSTFGYRSAQMEDWYYSAKMTFNTQITNGYHYPNREKPISKFFAPAYLYLGIGGEYAHPELSLRVFASPLTLKSTLVLSQELADMGAFGVKPAQYNAQNQLIARGARSLTELGILLWGQYEQTLWENIDMHHRISLYTDYIHHLGNIDIDWEMTFLMKVNKHVQARLGLHIKYDDDVKFFQRTDANGNTHAYGARLQLKQLLGVGVQYAF